jgi:predicted aldo/keto reductase-like oxidoreductase
MEYKTHGKLLGPVSRLGFGAMRLPQAGGEIDYAASEAMVDRLMQAGVNYYDTAYMYHGGKSEGFLRRALVERHPRASFTLATKMPGEGAGSLDKAKEIFAEQLERLGVGYIDYYLLHGIGKDGFVTFAKSGVLDWLEEKKGEGVIRRLGFSYHGANSDFDWVVSQRGWDFAQLMLNYYDWSIGADVLYKACEKRDIPVIVMEPVRGGGLARLPKHASEPFTKANPAASEASWALRWAASLPGVYVILSGMSSMEQAEDNITTFDAPNPLSGEEQDVIRRVLTAMRELPLIHCTECRYCSACPQGIEIWRLFGGYNDFVRFSSSWYLMHEYWKRPEENRASACIECGYCEEKCPQKLSVVEELRKAHAKALEVRR